MILSRLARSERPVFKSSFPAWAGALLRPVWRRIGPGAARETELDTGLQLAVIYLYQERNADAEPLLRDLSMRSTRALGPRAFLTLDINKNLAICIGRRGRMAEAEALHRETWAGWKAVRGDSHLAWNEVREEAHSAWQVAKLSKDNCC